MKLSFRCFSSDLFDVFQNHQKTVTKNVPRGEWTLFPQEAHFYRLQFFNFDLISSYSRPLIPKHCTSPEPKMENLQSPFIFPPSIIQKMTLIKAQRPRKNRIKAHDARGENKWTERHTFTLRLDQKPNLSESLKEIASTLIGANY